jgi:hypothetical protein
MAHVTFDSISPRGLFPLGVIAFAVRYLWTTVLISVR